MKISYEVILPLNPCKDRIDNFTSEYPSFDGDLKQFINLDGITYSDKVWVVTRLFTKEQNIAWACLCAESVLHIFEEKYPDDKRPRLVIEAAKSGNKANPAAYATSAAATTAATSAAYAAYAADAPAYAAAYAAEAATAATAAAAYAAYAAAKSAAISSTTAAAAYAAYAAYATTGKEQETKNLNFMLECL